MTRGARWVPLTLSLVLTAGCAHSGADFRGLYDPGHIIWNLSMAMGKNSPAVYSGDVRVSKGFPLGESGAALRPTVGYARSLFGGVEGEQDDFLNLGLQVRTAPLGDSPVWVGAESMYSRRWTGFEEDGAETETSNGLTFAALAGVPLGSGLGAYVAAGLNRYGGNGPYVRLGFELRR